MSREIKVGDRIKFLKDLTCGQTEEHPPYIYARKGELGTVTQIGGCWEGYWVLWDGWKHASFGCERKEFKLLENNNKNVPR